MTALIELSDAKAMLGISEEDTTDDLRLDALIGAASELIEVYLRRKLRYGEHEETAWQQGECLWLRGYPVTEVHEIKSGDQELDVSVALDKEAGLLRRKDGRPWPLLSEGYSVRYTGGLETIPKTIQQACLMMVQQLDETAKHGGGVVASERIGDYSVTYAAAGSAGAQAGSGLDAFSPAIEALLRPWIGRRV